MVYREAPTGGEKGAEMQPGQKPVEGQQPGLAHEQAAQRLDGTAAAVEAVGEKSEEAMIAAIRAGVDQMGVEEPDEPPATAPEGQAPQGATAPEGQDQQQQQQEQQEGGDDENGEQRQQQQDRKQPASGEREKGEEEPPDIHAAILRAQQAARNETAQAYATQTEGTSYAQMMETYFARFQNSIIQQYSDNPRMQNEAHNWVQSLNSWRQQQLQRADQMIQQADLLATIQQFQTNLENLGTGFPNLRRLMTNVAYEARPASQQNAATTPERQTTAPATPAQPENGQQQARRAEQQGQRAEARMNIPDAMSRMMMVMAIVQSIEQNGQVDAQTAMMLTQLMNTGDVDPRLRQHMQQSGEGGQAGPETQTIEAKIQRRIDASLTAAYTETMSKVGTEEADKAALMQTYNTRLDSSLKTAFAGNQVMVDIVTRWVQSDEVKVAQRRADESQVRPDTAFVRSLNTKMKEGPAMTLRADLVRAERQAQQAQQPAAPEGPGRAERAFALAGRGVDAVARRARDVVTAPGRLVANTLDRINAIEFGVRASINEGVAGMFARRAEALRQKQDLNRQAIMNRNRAAALRGQQRGQPVAQPVPAA